MQTNLLPGSQATADALNAEKTRLNFIAQNLANKNTTRDQDGLPYQRKVVTFESYLLPTSNKENTTEQLNQSVRIANISEDKSPGEVVYNPHHPHADADGYLHMPNVNTATEMVDLISASNAYKANLSAAKNSKQLAEQALAIGR